MTEESIFTQALAIDDPAQRQAYLSSACGEDHALRREVEALLTAHLQDSGFLSQPAPAQLAARDGPETPSTEALSQADQDPRRTDDTQGGEKPARDDDLAFLSPSRKAGHLGRLGHYEVLEVIGKGGFGIVLKAFDEKLHRMVAIKVLTPAIATSATARRRFTREARAAAAVAHDHVVTIHAVDDDHNPPYLVMQCIDGISLQDKLKTQGPLGLKEILRIGLQTAEGLAAAHKQGHVHRDIKPANILLENGIERVKITDFGLARAVDDASVTQSGVIAGTPMYMSPEQAEGLAVDHRSDLFSLGTVLYVMCTGRPPFRATGTMAILKRVVEETPRPIRETNPDIPDWLEAIVARLHAKKPADRFQTAKELAELLGQHLAHLQQPTHVPPPAPVVLKEQARPIDRATEVRVLTRRLKTAAPILAGVFVVLFVIGFFWFRGDTAIVSVDADADVQVTLIREEDGFTQDAASGDAYLSAGTYRVDVRCGAAHRLHSVSIIQMGQPLRTHGYAQGLISKDEFRLKLDRGERVTLAVRVRPPEAKESGWVQLFNGTDLTGWHQAGENWTVAEGAIVGQNVGKEPWALETHQMFGDFHCRLEGKINGDGGASLGVRAIPDNQGLIHIDAKGERGTGSLGFNANAITEPIVAWQSKDLAPADCWFSLEVIARGKYVTVIVNGTKTAEATIDRLPARGTLMLHVWKPGTSLHVRKIEIKELPPATLPDTAEQVLPALAGAWKGEYTQKIYGGKPDVKKISAVAVNDWIVGQKWLRQRVQLENEGFQSVTTYEPGAKAFRDWFFHSSGLIFGPSTGRWDAATRTLTWTNLPDVSTVLLMTLHFVDANTFTGEILIRDKAGKTVFEMSSLMKRTTENIAIDENISAGPLPKEMAVLDRVVGDWQTTGVIKNAKNPEGLKSTWQSSARWILGGRVIATQRFGDDESYSLATFDTFSKAYGRWSFRDDSNVLEYHGLWDDQNQTLKWHWAGKDGSQSSNIWPLRDPNRRDWQVIRKDALGKTTYEVRATSVRESDPVWVQLFNGKDLAGWKSHQWATWKVKDGLLISNGNRGFLAWSKDFQDFHCRVEAKVVTRGKTNVLFRDAFAGACGLASLESPFPNRRTGALALFKAPETITIGPWEKVPAGADGWFTLEIIAIGKKVTIKVDGAITVEQTIPQLPDRGALQLGIDDNGTVIHVRKIEIKELSPSPAAPEPRRSSGPATAMRKCKSTNV